MMHCATLILALALAMPEPIGPIEGDFEGVETVPLKAGETAPFRGLLLPEDVFIELLEAQVRARELEITLATTRRTADALEAIYLARLEAALAVPWYETPTANRWIGVLLGGAVTGVAVWAAVELAPRR